MTEEAPLRPSTETNVLLGRLEAKVDAVKEEQGASRQELSTMRSELAVVQADVAVLKAQQGPRMSWTAVAAGLGSIVTTISVVAALIILFTK